MTDGTAPIDRSPTHIPEAIQVSSLILEYLRRKHQTLRNDYHTPDGIYYESCTELACDVAKLSLKEGIKPSLLSVRGETLPDGVNTKTLVPKLFEGRVTWGGHVVCAKGDIILDPMVGNPMTREEYAREVFDSPVVLKEKVKPESIEEFISRGESNEIT